MGTDLVTVNLQSGALHPPLSRQSSDELLYAPVLMLDGSTVVFQHTAHGATPGTRVEQVGLDGSPTGLVIDDPRFPVPSADGSSVAFVRYVDQHAEFTRAFSGRQYRTRMLGSLLYRIRATRPMVRRSHSQASA
jgi:hypothetical protein